VEALKARAERVRAVERWQTSLDALNRLVEFRRSARISRDRSGNVVSISDDSDLQHWRSAFTPGLTPGVLSADPDGDGD